MRWISIIFAMGAIAALSGCNSRAEQDTTPVAGAETRPTAEPGKVVVGSGATARQVPAEQLFPPKKP